MPNRLPITSRARIARLPDGLHRADRNLYVRVAGGSRLWMFVWRDRRGQRKKSLGPVALLDVDDAKAQALDLRRKLRDGVEITPPTGRPVGSAAGLRRTPDFEQVARDVIVAKTPTWRDPRGPAIWASTLERYAFPVIGRLQPAAVTTDHVVEILRPIWVQKHETASRLRQRIEIVLDAAKVRGFREGENPARLKGHLDLILPTPHRAKRHHAAVAVKDAPVAFARICAAYGMGALALRFAILTAARSGEVRGARAEEIDRRAALWTVPGERMKRGKEHRVPLSAAAMEALTDVKAELVWPGAGGRPLSDMTLSAVHRRLGLDATVHGWRSTFRDWCAQENVDRDLAEMCLAHTVGSAVTRAYLRSDALDARRAVMERWAAYLTSALFLG